MKRLLPAILAVAAVLAAAALLWPHGSGPGHGGGDSSGNSMYRVISFSVGAEVKVGDEIIDPPAPNLVKLLASIILPPVKADTYLYPWFYNAVVFGDNCNGWEWFNNTIGFLIAFSINGTSYTEPLNTSITLVNDTIVIKANYTINVTSYGYNTSVPVVVDHVGYGVIGYRYDWVERNGNWYWEPVRKVADYPVLSIDLNETTSTTLDISIIINVKLLDNDIRSIIYRVLSNLTNKFVGSEINIPCIPSRLDQLYLEIYYPDTYWLITQSPGEEIPQYIVGPLLVVEEPNLSIIDFLPVLRWAMGVPTDSVLSMTVSGSQIQVRAIRYYYTSEPALTAGQLVFQGIPSTPIYPLVYRATQSNDTATCIEYAGLVMVRENATVSLALGYPALRLGLNALVIVPEGVVRHELESITCSPICYRAYYIKLCGIYG